MNGKIIKQSVGYIAEHFFKKSKLDWVNCQKLLAPFYCLGDGHAGIWKLFKQIGEPGKRREILDWYHLKENLHKVGGYEDKKS